MARNYVRVDDRLIHGQILARWAVHLGIDNIVAVDDGVASDPALSAIMAMSVPRQYNTKICTVEQSRDVLARLNATGANNLVITRYPASLVDIVVGSGIEVESVNIGSVSRRGPDAREVTPNSYLTPEDVRALEVMRERGKEIYFQLVPDSTRVLWESVRRKYVKAGG